MIKSFLKSIIDLRYSDYIILKNTVSISRFHPYRGPFSIKNKRFSLECYDNTKYSYNEDYITAYVP